jgi:glycogen debranching enzyme
MRRVFWWMVMVCSVSAAQTAGSHPMDAFPLQENGLALHQHSEAGMPFTVAGTRGVILGDQDGSFETWILPIKLLSHFTIVANVAGYPVPIDLNSHAAEIQVFPDHTTLTYSHIAFTVRQIMLAPNQTEEGTGAVVLFQIDSTRAMDLTFSFTPEMRSMWPQLNEGVPSGEWVKQGTSGFYVLHMDYPDLAGAVAMPDTQPGILSPYQEKPHFYPLQLTLHYDPKIGGDPKIDGNRYYPLLMAVGRTVQTANTAALQAKLERLSAGLPQLYAAHAAEYARMSDRFTSIQTPDAALDSDFSWAEMSIEQLRTRVLPGDDIGLVAGYYSSGDSARPGFGWFFGRDALYTLYAVNGFGDFALSRDELEFLMKRQRDDGKIMHEYSQTAAFSDWKSLPYMYAAADSTPLFLTAMLDYVRMSGDMDFLRSHRAEVEKAWQFETSHDSDGDGIYDNSQGSGWVESWPTGDPHQEIYLALLDQQASAAMAKLSNLLNDAATAGTAESRATQLRTQIEAEYYDPSRQAYAFSRNANGTLDYSSTVFPTIAWWNGGEGLAHPEPSFRRWASHDFSTDWGLRDLAESEPFYDPISYHQGSVWPLFTGWASLAEYRSGHALSGYAHLMQNAEQTTTQDLGAVTELLSGAFFEPFGRSTSHQLWSSAMVITPALRGMFGIEVDGLSRTIALDPHLPADWKQAEVDKLHVGPSLCSLKYEREGQSLAVGIENVSGPAVRLASNARGARVAADGLSVAFTLPPVEIAVPHGLPLPGARTSQMKVLEEAWDAHSLTLTLEADEGAAVTLKVRRNAPKLLLHAEGGTLVAAGHDAAGPGLDSLDVNFPSGRGYQQKTVILRW